MKLERFLSRLNFDECYHWRKTLNYIIGKGRGIFVYLVFLQGKGGKGQAKRKAPDELWTEGIVAERQNPLISFLEDKLPKEFLHQVNSFIYLLTYSCIHSSIHLAIHLFVTHSFIHSYFYSLLPVINNTNKCFQDPSVDVLNLIRVLHALNRFWYTLYPGTRPM